MTTKDVTVTPTAKPRHYRISNSEREYFITNLVLLLKAAVPVGESMRTLQDGIKQGNYRKALAQMEHDIDDGLHLWQALEHSGVAGGQTLALARIGEESGTLVASLETAAKQEAKQQHLQAKIRAALLYPAFVLGMTVTVGLGVAWFLLPKLAVTFDQLNVELPLISKIFIGLGQFLKTDGYWAVPAALGLMATMIYLLFGAPRTRHLGQRLLFITPGIKRLVQEVEIARFGYLFGSLLDAGLPVNQAWRLVHQATTTPAYHQFYGRMSAAFDDGFGFKGSFQRTPHTSRMLPPTVQQMIVASERSGTLPETLNSIGQTYEQKTDITTQNLETLLEPVLLIFVWLGVMAVAIAVILPIYSLVGGLNG